MMLFQSNPLTIDSGVVSVPTAGTAVPLSSDPTPSLRVIIKAHAGQPNLVYVGDADVDSANGYPLADGEDLSLEYVDLSHIYVDSDDDAAQVHYIVIK